MGDINKLLESLEYTLDRVKELVQENEFLKDENTHLKGENKKLLDLVDSLTPKETDKEWIK